MDVDVALEDERGSEEGLHHVSPSHVMECDAAILFVLCDLSIHSHPRRRLELRFPHPH